MDNNNLRLGSLKSDDDDLFKTPLLANSLLTQFDNSSKIHVGGTMIDSYMTSLPSQNPFTNPIISFQKDTNYEQILELRRELKEEREHKETIKADTVQLKKSIQKEKDINAKLEKQYLRGNIISRLNEDGVKLVMESDIFLNEFTHLRKCNSVVVSIDIRRSTELMLKASSSEDFAKFITGLSEKLSTCIKLNYGVFDKFTGDGILAFFPDFYTGENAFLYALKSAEECHKIFLEHYNYYQDSFDVFLEDIGLGIGIDYGEVSIVNSQAELTVVGKPVVYACRFSSANAGETLIGQNAKKLIDKSFKNMITFEQTSLFIKNEGNARGYKILNAKFEESKPDWNKYTTSEESIPDTEISKIKNKPRNNNKKNSK